VFARTPHCDDAVVTVHAVLERLEMTSKLQRFRHAMSFFAAEDRPNFKRVDASPVAYDDGAWLRPLA
jgi:hypothetical protein